MKDAKEQLKIILKGVEQLVSQNDLEQKLKQDRPLIIKLGLDPTAPDIHLGHAVVLRKIKQMQDLGHEAVIIIGDFTGQVGDPTGKTKGRKQLSEEVVKENAKTYVDQICKVLDPRKTSIRFNSEWQDQLDFKGALSLAQSISVARLLERDDFQKRYQNHIPIGLHEFFYPLMQAYDSVAIKADIEIGGTDQMFNILMGRNLQKHWELEKQVALFMPLLEGLDGKEKMSKSLGNYIGIDEAAPVMFKKIMEIPDSLIIKYFELATDLHPDEIDVIRTRLAEGENPRDVKLELAAIITELYHGSEQAEFAKVEFQAVFQRGLLPTDILKIPMLKEERLAEIIPRLVEQELVASKSAFRRLVAQDGVSFNGEKLQLDDLEQPLKENDVLKIGKKKFVQFV